MSVARPGPSLVITRKNPNRRGVDDRLGSYSTVAIDNYLWRSGASIMLMTANPERLPRAQLTAHGLALLLKRDKLELISDWQNRVRRLPNAKELATPILIDHIPNLLDELIQALEESKSCELLDTPT